VYEMDFMEYVVEEIKAKICANVATRTKNYSWKFNFN